MEEVKELSGLISQIENDLPTDILVNDLLEELKYLKTCLNTRKSSFPPLSSLWERFRNQEEAGKLLKDVGKLYSALKERQFMISEINEHSTLLNHCIYDLSIYGNIPPLILDKVRVLAYNLMELSETPITTENHTPKEYIESLVILTEELELRML